MSRPTKLRSAHFRTVSVSLLCWLTIGCGPAGQSGVDKSQLRKEVARLQFEAEKLEKIKSQHEALLERVTDLRDELKAESAPLQSQLQSRDARRELLAELGRWMKATYVLGNDLSPCIAAVAKDEDGVHVTAFAAHPFQQYALHAVIEAAVPRHAGATNEQHLQWIRGQVRRGQSLPLLLPDKPPPPIKPAQFVVFRDARTDQQQVVRRMVGDEQRAAGNQKLAILAVSDAKDRLAEAALVAGSFWEGTGSEIEPFIEKGEPFVDYCMLAITECLHNRQFDESNAILSLVAGEIEQPEKAESSYDFYSRSRQSFRGSRQNYALAAMEQEDPKAAMTRVQDGLSARLTERKWRVLERRFTEKLRGEDIKRNRELAGTYSSGATHLVVTELTRESNQDFVSVRLIDARTSETLWEANNRKSAITNRNWKKYVLLAGTPVIVRFKNVAARDSYWMHLSNADQLALPPRQMTTVAIHEASPGGGVALRHAFGTKLWNGNEKDVELTPIPSARDANLSDLFIKDLRTSILPYITYRFATHVAPVAGRIELTGETSEPLNVSLPLGSADRLLPSSRFRLQFFDADGEIRMNQQFVAIVNDVVDRHQSRLMIPRMPTLDSMQSPRGIAICDSTPEFKCAVYTPWVEVPLSTKEKYVQAKIKGNEIGKRLQAAMVQNFSSHFDCRMGTYHFRYSGDEGELEWHQNIDGEKSSAVAAAEGVTHVVVSRISPLNKDDFVVRVALQELSKDVTGTWAPGEIRDSAVVTLSADDF